MKGKRPHFDIYVGRKVKGTEFTENSKWCKFHHESFENYEIRIRRTLTKDLKEIIGKRIGCWCINTDKTTPLICHAQILLKLILEINETI